jgi:hypothetical protein
MLGQEKPDHFILYEEHMTPGEAKEKRTELLNRLHKAYKAWEKRHGVAMGDNEDVYDSEGAFMLSLIVSLEDDDIVPSPTYRVVEELEDDEDDDDDLPYR